MDVISDIQVETNLGMVRKIAMAELSQHCGRKKLLLRYGHQIGAKVGALISQAEFDPQILAVEIDSGFGNIEHIGDLFAGFAVFNQSGNLHLLGGQQYSGIGKAL